MAVYPKHHYRNLETLDRFAYMGSFPETPSASGFEAQKSAMAQLKEGADKAAEIEQRTFDQLKKVIEASHSSNLTVEDLQRLREVYKAQQKPIGELAEKLKAELDYNNEWLNKKENLADEWVAKRNGKRLIKQWLETSNLGGKSEYETFVYAAEEAKEKIGKVAYSEFQKNIGEFVETGRFLERLEKNPNYKKTVEAYDVAVSSGVWSSSEFAVFQESHEHVEDVTVAREYKQLFLALIQTETNNFENGFVLGDQWNNDPKTNRENYPFIYEKWLERSGGANIVKQQEKAQEEYDQVAANPPNLSDGSAIASLVKKDMPAIATLPTNIDDAKQRIADLESIASHHRDEKASKRLTAALDATFDTDQATLKKYVEIAEKQLTLVRVNAQANKIDQEFTKENLEKKMGKFNWNTRYLNSKKQLKLPMDYSTMPS
ncbi:hypothetical protein IPJ72_00315 [Candidatus Peregrinibacteria bacterium]|nr:MAG: hypothetical protein IPJ72_00315 [Candidatus Peregrinibacteria bacterium]